MCLQLQIDRLQIERLVIHSPQNFGLSNFELYN